MVDVVLAGPPFRGQIQDPIRAVAVTTAPLTRSIAAKVDKYLSRQQLLTTEQA